MSELPTQMGQSVGGRGQIIRSTFDFTPQALGELVDYLSVNQPRISISSLVGLKYLMGSTTWDPPSLLNGNGTAVNVTLQGATPGDFVLVSLNPFPAGDWLLSGTVSAQDTVTIRLLNLTGGTVDVPSSALNVAIIR